MLADFKNSFIVGFSSKFATRLATYFPPHLKCVTILPCEIERINYSNSVDVFNSITDLFLIIIIALESYKMLKMHSFDMNTRLI